MLNAGTDDYHEVEGKTLIVHIIIMSPNSFTVGTDGRTDRDLEGNTRLLFLFCFRQRSTFELDEGQRMVSWRKASE